MSMNIHRVSIGDDADQGRKARAPSKTDAQTIDAASPGARRSGLVQGGLGGPEDELLESGQEEVFARSEVESGRIEHHAETDARPGQTEVKPSSPNTSKGDDNG